MYICSYPCICLIYEFISIAYIMLNSLPYDSVMGLAEVSGGDEKGKAEPELEEAENGKIAF